MYSLLLMSAMATGGETPASGWGVGCYGGSCSGVVVSGCSGYAAPAGCCGGEVAAFGCCGGRGLFPLFPGLRARLAARFSCGGCSGYAASCYGSACYGASCHGSAYYGSSCHGSSLSVSAYGAYGPAVYAPSLGGCGGFGGVVAPTFGYGFAGLPSLPQGYGIGGCIGSGGFGSPYYGSDFGPIISTGTPALEVMPPLPAITLPTSDASEQRENEKFAAQDYKVASAKPTTASPARLTIELPADAVLYVDGEKVNGTGPTRNFHTPELPAGNFFYDLKAVVKVNDEPITETVRVVVKAGDTKTQSFGKLLAAVQGSKSPSLVSNEK